MSMVKRPSLEDLTRLFADLNSKKSKPKGISATLHGDPIRFRPVELEGNKFIQIDLPNSQTVYVPDGTRGERYTYFSGGREKAFGAAYLNGRVKIVSM